MRFHYYDLYNQQFEELVTSICIEILGSGTQPFSTGPDGGRDARFHGTAENFPSKVNPLSGRFVIQAKHTEHPFAKYSDTDFSGESPTAVVNKEIPRIKRLVDEQELDHYIMFSNRRLGGKADEKIRKKIIKKTGAKSVELFGIERIDTLLKKAPHIEETARIFSVNSPLRITPDDLAEVIISLSEETEIFSKAKDDVSKLERTSFDKKTVLSHKIVRKIE